MTYHRAEFSGRSFILNNALFSWDGDYLRFQDLIDTKNAVTRIGLLKLALWFLWRGLWPRPQSMAKARAALLARIAEKDRARGRPLTDSERLANLKRAIFDEEASP